MQRQLDAPLLTTRCRWHYNSFTDRYHYERASKWATTRCLTPNTREERTLQQDAKILFNSYTNILHFTDYACYMTQCKCILHFIIIIQSFINRTTVNDVLKWYCVLICLTMATCGPKAKMLYPTVAVGWGTLPVRSKQNGKITNLHYNDIIGWSEGFLYPQCASQSLPTVAKLGTLGAKRLYLCVTVRLVTVMVRSQQSGKITNLHNNDIIYRSDLFLYYLYAWVSLPTVAKFRTLGVKRLYLCVTVGFVTLAAQ